MLHQELLRDIMAKFNTHRRNAIRDDLHHEVELLFDKHESSIKENTNDTDRDWQHESTIKENTNDNDADWLLKYNDAFIQNLEKLLAKESVDENETSCIQAMHNLFNKTQSREQFIEGEAFVKNRSKKSDYNIYEEKYWAKADELRRIIQELVDKFGIAKNVDIP